MIELADLAPFVAELVAWLGPDECSPELAGLIGSAPSDLLALERVGLAGAQTVAVPWTLDAIVKHALVPLAGLSLVDGQPMIPALAAVLGRVLTDERLSPASRESIIRALAEHVVMLDRLGEVSRGCE